MSELRFNELRGEQVAYAIHRQDRTFLPDRAHCPLDPTRPGGPPTEIPLEEFEIVVFDNRFPAFESPAGAAEVVVYTDDHDGSFASLPPERAEALMWVWRHRYEELGAREDVDYVYIFENRGVEIGVTLHHPHGQIYGYPFLPPGAGARAGRRRATRRLRAVPLLELERARGPPVVYENEASSPTCPTPPAGPTKPTWRCARHRASLLDCEPEELRLLAVGLQQLVRGYDALFERPMPYVMAVHQAPTGGSAGRPAICTSSSTRRCARAEKLKYPAGSEQGAGTFISDVLPEDAAAALREAIARAG